MPPGGREILFPKKRGGDGACVWLAHSKGKVRLKSSYYIGVDWIDKQNAIYIAPKLNEGARQTDYLKMLFSCLKHPEVLEHTDDLFEIKFDQPFLEIEQKQDLLTPLLVIQFLRVVHSIVKKGLKKSYYPIEENLHGRIKSKVLVGQTIKQNIVKNRPLNTLCRYEEFGWNGLENRLLKKALLFSQRYLAGGISGFTVDVSTVMNYCLPAFETVSEKIGLTEIKYTKTNAFYKEYKECTRLAKLILKRFGYNIQTVKQNKEVKVPPFWIDMSKLFELYVLGLLKDKFGKDVWYHFTTQWNELDYLLNTPTHKMVIDAKYKPVYQNSYDINDIRQLSGYARIANVVSELGVDPGQVVDCLIIYPDQYLGANEIFPEKFKSDPIGKFIRFYKMGVKLPEITT
ncbi:MAG: hypothetical protein H6557_34170 [Lewinellaceae bacterium]|nr:hypothetical protein [Lewinellaceae bacterium]